MTIAKSRNNADSRYRGVVDWSDLQPKPKRLKFRKPVYSVCDQAATQPSVGAASGELTYHDPSQPSDIDMSDDNTFASHGGQIWWSTSEQFYVAGVGDITESRLGSDYSASEVPNSPRTLGAVVDSEQMEDVAVEEATANSVGASLEGNPFVAMSRAEQEKALQQALHNVRLLEAFLRDQTEASTGNPSSSSTGEAGSTPSRSHITGRDPHSGNLRFDQVSTSPGASVAPEPSNDVTIRNAGNTAEVIPTGDTSHEGGTSATYSSETVPTPSPVTAEPPSAAPSPPSGGNRAEASDASARAGLHNLSAALNVWRTSPTPPSTPAASDRCVRREQ